jgi:hypothetical protein
MELLAGDKFKDGGLDGGHGGPKPGGDQDGDLKEIASINQKVVKDSPIPWDPVV